MRSDLLISVIIPIYNSAEYLNRCLDSVLSNTYVNLEVICINDGSTDNSVEVLNEYAKHDDRIVIINQENSGVSVARNAGLDYANGDYIAFIDSDDWVHQQYFEIMINQAFINDADCVACGANVTSNCETNFPEYGKITAYQNDLETFVKNSVFRNYIWGRIYKYSLINGLHFPLDVPLAEDTIFNVTALCTKEDIRLFCVDERLYYYFQHSDSAVHSLPLEMIVRVLPHWLDLVKSVQTPYQRKIISDRLSKSIYAYRYSCSFGANYHYIKKECSSLLKESRKFRNDFPLRKRLLYLTLDYFPQIYRLFLLINDPTLKQYEKNMKSRNKSQV